MSAAIDMLQYEVIQHALLLALLISLPCAVLSCFLVLKGWALMGDAIAHAVLPGIALSFILGLPLALGAFVAGLGCAGLVGFISANSRVKPDTAMGVVFSGLFGIGLVMIGFIQTEIHLAHILFGSILNSDWSDIFQTAMIGLPIFLGVIFFRKDITLDAFDPVQARALGLNTKLIHYGLLAAISLTIVITLKAAGLIMAIGLLIAPGATAFLLVDRLDRMMLIAIIKATSSTFLGVAIAFELDAAPAPSIILVMSIIFLITLIFAPQKGLLFRAR